MHPTTFNLAGALGAGIPPEQITSYLVSKGEPTAIARANGVTGKYDIAGALKAGYSPAEIVDYLNPSRGQANYQNVPVLAPIQRGLTAAEGGVANLAQVVGLTGVAGAIRSRLSQAVVDTKTSASNVVDGIRGGHYGAALEAVPSALLEGALPAAATIGAGAVAGPLAAIGTAAGVGALTQGDALARARAANNGHTTPSASDLALGLAGGAGVGALGAVGLPRVVGNAAGTGLKGALLSSAAHATADALIPQADALAGSAGTSAGAQLAPASDSAAAAIEGLAGRAAMAAPGVAAGMTPAARNTALANRWANMAPADQAFMRNVAAAHGAMTDAMQNSVGSSAVTPRQAAATASDAISSGVAKLTSSLQDRGLLDRDDAATITGTMRAARQPSTALTNDHLDALAGLALHPDDVGTLQDAATQLNLLSSPDAFHANAGPFQGAANAVSGHVGGAIVGGLLGGYHGAGLGYLVGGAVRPAVRSVLGGAGSAIDGALGFNASPLERSASQATALLNAAGVDVPNTQADLAGAVATSRDALTQQRQIMGLLSQAEASAKVRSDYFDASPKIKPRWTDRRPQWSR